MSKYEKLALEMGAINAKMITFQDLALDPRVYLKCIGCAEYGTWSLITGMNVDCTPLPYDFHWHIGLMLF